jgi:hypothetical protein
MSQKAVLWPVSCSIALLLKNNRSGMKEVDLFFGQIGAETDQNLSKILFL